MDAQSIIFRSTHVKFQCKISLEAMKVNTK